MRLAALIAVGCLGLSSMGCRSSTGDAHTVPSAAVPSSAVATTMASAAAPALPPKLAYVFERGCAGDIDGKLSGTEQLEALGRACAPGLERLDTWNEPVDLIADQARRLEVELPEHACIRIGIVSEGDGAVLRVALRDPQGRGLVGEASSPPPVAVPPEGPVCTGAGGRHVLEVTSLGSGKRVHLGLWRAEPPPAPASST